MERVKPVPETETLIYACLIRWHKSVVPPLNSRLNKRVFV
jgi:hypothetical protein